MWLIPKGIVAAKGDAFIFAMLFCWAISRNKQTSSENCYKYIMVLYIMNFI
jgi:hypothetical protein